MNDVNVNEKLSGIGEILSYGSQMLLVGMAAIFSVLLIIMLFIKLLQFCLAGSGEKKETATVSQPKAPDVKASLQAGLDEEIVAVIAAAIAMAESESAGLKFRVVSFRKK